jgi:hypothetical protein
MGAIISKLWTPMTITEERHLKPTLGGRAPPHGSGGWPIPRALALRARRAGPGPRGGPRSGPTRASPPQAESLRAMVPRVGRPGAVTLRAGGGDLWLAGGAGARDLEAAPSPLWPALPHLWAGPPNFGDSVVVTARPAQRSKETSGQHNFFSTTPN